MALSRYTRAQRSGDYGSANSGRPAGGAGIMADYVEPLDPILWFTRIELIADGALGCVENSLRHAAHLLQLSPLPLRPFVGLSIDVELFEALLDSGDFDTAARHLVAHPTALSVDRANGAKLIAATIKCSALGRNIRGVADTVANAVLDAWTTCLLAVKTEFGADLSRLVPQFRHEAQRALHRRSSPH